MDYRPGMHLYALAFLLGILSVQHLAVLPSTDTLLYLFIFCCVAIGYCGAVVCWQYSSGWLFNKRYYTLIISFILLIILGIFYCIYYAKQELSLRLDETLSGTDILIVGQVSSIPVHDGKVSRFEFDVESHRLPGTDDNLETTDFPERVRLSWYYGEAVKAGERWQLEIRLKPPHGFMNPGGFDYEAWLLQHGIHATGYVRKSDLNRLEQGASFSINRIRQHIAQDIDDLAFDVTATEVSSFALIKALAIGDKSAISAQQWRVLAATGTSHLMAISGLHIGLASLFAYLLIRWAIPVYLMKRYPAQHIALAGGMLAAFLYALIAGLSIPTQRAVIMLSVLCVMLLARRNHRPVDALGFALMAVLIADPLSVLSAGFWFSFSAVAVIFISLRSSHLSEVSATPKAEYSSWWRVVAVLKQWVRLQLLISLFLLPLSLYMFQQVSLVSPVANLLLIPYVSFLIVPLVLAALVVSIPLPYISELLFILAASLLDLVWPVLVYLSELPFSLLVKGSIGIIELLAATAGILLVYYSNVVPQIFSFLPNWISHRCQRLTLVLIGCSFIVPVFIIDDPSLTPGEYRLTVLDVGQGSAAVIRTLDHVAVFDSGASFGERLNAGSSVVIPYLYSQGIDKLERLIISHGDADHIGGAEAILQVFPDALLLGQDIDTIPVQHKQLCSAGLRWLWDGVTFEFLSPTLSEGVLRNDDKRNNRSCVLRVTSSAGSVLFTGDIEQLAERKLLASYGTELDSDILIVPHHGSNSSSGSAFLRAVSPDLSIISVGYKNRYRLPSSRVVERYRSMDMALLQTDQTGAITVNIKHETGLSIEKYREKAAKYWHHRSAL
jgi:competence protein ComEC